MKQTVIYFFFFLLFHTGIYAQINNNVYGLARDPNNLYLATINPATGVATNVSTQSVGLMMSIGGAALNPYTSTFHYFGYNTIESIDLVTGNVTNSAPLNHPLGQFYFDFPHFNNSDSLIYGLARRYIAATNTGEVYLSNIDPATGTISLLSANSIASGILINAGSVLDPYQMIYYYSTGNTLMGVDMYNGAVYSNPTTSFAQGIYFDNMVFNCADSMIYGLVRQNFYDTTYLSFDSTMFSLDLDSASLLLGTINPTTGAITTISTNSLGSGFSLNASATINPNTQVYYFQGENGLVGVDIASGNMVSQQTVSNTNGLYFDLMRHYQNCMGAKKARFPSVSTSISSPNATFSYNLYPNPGENTLNVSSSAEIIRVEITDITGKNVYQNTYNRQEISVDVNGLLKGIYIVKIYDKNGTFGVRKWIKE